MSKHQEVALVDYEIVKLIKQGNIASAYPIPNDRKLEEHVQPASIDIPIGSIGYLVKDKILPFKKQISDLIDQITLQKLNTENLVLLKGQTYLFPCVNIEFSEDFRATLSPKSSIGRVDVMVRAIFDGCGLYDTIERSKSTKGQLWIEVSPRSFNIRIKTGFCFTQMMIFKGNKEVDISVLSATTQSITENIDVIFNKDDNKPIKKTFHKSCLVLTLELSEELVGYEAIATNDVVDLTKRTNPALKFFRPITFKKSGQSIILEKDRFYILSTKEKISIPTSLSAEMIPFSHNIGELRAHYAGFFDPGFGYGSSGEIKGTVGVLEVRPHETIRIFDGQPICLMEYFHNSDIPLKPYGSAGNNYQGQTGPRLAKFFQVS